MPWALGVVFHQTIGISAIGRRAILIPDHQHVTVLHVTVGIHRMCGDLEGANDLHAGIWLRLVQVADVPHADAIVERLAWHFGARRNLRNGPQPTLVKGNDCGAPLFRHQGTGKQGARRSGDVGHGIAHFRSSGCETQGKQE